ncbi:MAG: NYN domain-containing protein [Deltaproteobacteria bacterium]|uniref:NYN domain-containing protein n=1 Tax=Candidatus Zymogenus saltonus TaxID=2844893 RepID=A0A9D8KE87_9DELT|nr:NYN domain-containing protein [Candidatus Zymogenus saltonus]
MHVIIDGYNVIMTAAEYGAVSGRKMRAARSGLINDLIRYRKVRGHAVTVVFDAVKAGGVERVVERSAGINVIFTKGEERADDVIVELVEKAAGVERVVVTSDREVVRASERRGAASISSESFIEKMSAAIGSGDGREVDDERERGKTGRSRSRGETSLNKL